MAFNDQISAIKELLSKDKISDSIKKLHEILDEKSSKTDLLILIAADHKSLDKNVISGVIEYHQEQLHLARIRGKFLKLVNSLEEEDIILVPNVIKSELDTGYKDFSANILITLNKLTPEIARNKFAEFRDKINQQRDKIKDAYKEKEVQAGSAYRKIMAMKKTGNNTRLYRKYLSEFAAAFEDIDRQWVVFANILDKVKNDSSILALYLVQNAFTVNELDQSTYAKMIDGIKKMLDQFSKLVYLLDEKKQRDQLFLYQNEVSLRELNIIRNYKSAIETKTILRDSLTQFSQEWVITLKAMMVYEKEINGKVN